MAVKLPDAYDTLYWEQIRQKARELESDGCSLVPDFYVDACYEHDVHYRTHRTLYGDEIQKEEADWLLGQRIREFATKNLSWNPLTWDNVFGYPMSVWRWLAVRLDAHDAWFNESKGSPLTELCSKDPQVPQS